MIPGACPPSPARQQGGLVCSHAGVPLLLALAIVPAACDGPGPDTLRGETHPIWAVGADVATYEFGPGALETTGDEPWDGSSWLIYPVVLNTETFPVEVEVQGVDLSGVEYGGDLGWPPDGTDTGAIFQAILTGSTTVSYRVFSSLAAFGSATTLDHADGHRAYQFSGFNGEQGPFGLHQLPLERWSPADSGSSYDTFDLRLRYDRGWVQAWVRMHASRDWDEAESTTGADCPTNVAINNAAEGTVDSVWDGQCAGARPGATGRAVGAWVPVQGGAWRAADEPGPSRVMLLVSNWAFAEGPYRVTWQNLIVRGRQQEGYAHSAGAGQFRAFGTGRAEREPRGEWAAFSYVASARGSDDVSTFFRYRAPGLEITMDQADWVDITTRDVTLRGRARVNGADGYRMEFHGLDVRGSEPARVDLRLWRLVPSVRPHFVAFGSLSEGSIELQPVGVD